MTAYYLPIASVQTAAKSTVASVFETMVRLYPERPAVQDEQCSLTYRALGEEVNRIARGLLSMDLERGDWIGLDQSLDEVATLRLVWLGQRGACALAQRGRQLVESVRRHRPRGRGRLPAERGGGCHQ